MTRRSYNARAQATMKNRLVRAAKERKAQLSTGPKMADVEHLRTRLPSSACFLCGAARWCEHRPEP